MFSISTFPTKIEDAGFAGYGGQQGGYGGGGGGYDQGGQGGYGGGQQGEHSDCLCAAHLLKPLKITQAKRQIAT